MADVEVDFCAMQKDCSDARLRCVSIIVPVYNVEKYIRKCIDSILSQSFKKWELLLIDDGSSDMSGVICDIYAEKNPRIRVFHKDNAGVSNARNIGISLAVGKYITFVDADDWIEESYLENMISPICNELLCKNCGGNTSIDVVISQSYIHSKHSGYTSARHAVTKLFENELGAGMVWGRLYKRKLLSSFKFSEKLKRGEDFLANWYILNNADRVYWIAKGGYHYTVREDSLSHNLKDPVCRCDAVYMHQKILKDAKKRNISTQLLYNIQLRFLHECCDAFREMFVCVPDNMDLTKLYFSVYDDVYEALNVLKSSLLRERLKRIYHREIESVRSYYLLCMKDLRKIVKENGNIYIYGNGATGKQIHHLLKMKNIIPNGFLISDGKSKGKNIESVYTISEIPNRRNDVIILGLGIRYCIEVLPQLIKQNRNIMIF